MVLYEFSAFNAEDAPDVRSYDPERRNDCGRFAALVGEYIGARIGTAAIPDPAMLLTQGPVPDMVIANHVASVVALDKISGGRINDELAAICASDKSPLHASEKSASARFKDADFATVSIANHGRTLHDLLFEPLCRKILGASCRDLLASYHRAAWLPLYYPETLLSQFGAAPQQLPPTRFHYPAEGSASALVRALAIEVGANPQIHVVHGAMRSISGGATHTLELVDGSRFTADDFAWTLDPGTLMSLVDPGAPRSVFSRASIGLCFAAVPQRRITNRTSTLFIPAADRAAYRVTDQEVCAGIAAAEHRLVIEFSPIALAARGIHKPEQQQQALFQELTDSGLIDAPESVAYCAVKIFDNALMIPTSANRSLFQTQLSWLQQRLPSAHLAGLSAAFHTSAMNDQIVQGLKLGALLGGMR
jgi:hypothetical protein